ncbi:hypothetical protein AKJ16_DCAP11551 [Drosera capensis]
MVDIISSVSHGYHLTRVLHGTNYEFDLDSIPVRAVQDQGGPKRLVDIIRVVPELSRNYFKSPARRALFGGIALLGGFYVAQTISLSFGALGVNDVIPAASWLQHPTKIWGFDVLMVLLLCDHGYLGNEQSLTLRLQAVLQDLVLFIFMNSASLPLSTMKPVAAAVLLELLSTRI